MREGKSLFEKRLFFRDEKSRERFRRSKSLCELPTPHRLKWNLNNFLKQNITSAKESLQK